MRSLFIPLFWQDTELTNIMVSGLKVIFSIIRSFHNGARWFSDCLSGPQHSVLFERPVASQNRVENTLRMIVKVAYFDILKFSLVPRLRGTKQEKQIIFRQCPLGFFLYHSPGLISLKPKLNFNVSKLNLKFCSKDLFKILCRMSITYV